MGGQTDYGVKGGVDQHASTMAWANEKWAAQNAGVNGQQSSDAWRNTGPKAAWGQAADPQPPKIAFSQKNATTLPYGQTDYGVAGGIAYHETTMGLANERWARQNAGVEGQEEEDKWRKTGRKTKWESA